MRRMTLVSLMVALHFVSACGQDNASLAVDPGVVQQHELEASDIYKVEGGLLYALISGRALRVFDITNARSPQLMGKAERI